jgi:hypothetical protein
MKFQKSAGHNAMAKTALDLMPPMRHGGSAPFDISKSEVVQWLLRREDLQQFLFNTAKSSGLIEYDRDTKLWTGISYHACRKVADRGGSADEIAKARKVS